MYFNDRHIAKEILFILKPILFILVTIFIDKRQVNSLNKIDYLLKFNFYEIICLFFILYNTCSSQTTGSSGSNKTDLSTGGGISADSWWHTNMLMVTSSKWMLYGLFLILLNKYSSLKKIYFYVVKCKKLNITLYLDNDKTNVHSHTPDFRPTVALGLVLVVGSSGFQERLVNTSTSSNNTWELV